MSRRSIGAIPPIPSQDYAPYTRKQCLSCGMTRTMLRDMQICDYCLDPDPIPVRRPPCVYLLGLPEIRKAQGLRQTDIAHDAGVQPRRIGRAERGEVRINKTVAQGIANRLEVELEKIVG